VEKFAAETQGVCFRRCSKGDCCNRVAGVKFVRAFFGKGSETRGFLGGGGVVRPCQAAESKGQQIWRQNEYLKY